MYKSLIGTGQNHLVFDIGASCGTKTAIFLKLGTKVVAIEPDRVCLKVLKARFKNNKNVFIVDKAVSDEEGSGKFYITGGGSGFNTLSSKWTGVLRNAEINRFGYKMRFDSVCDIQTVGLSDLFQKFGIPYYIKIDAEGYERNILKGLSQAIPLLSFEANLPEFKEETIDCLRYLYNITPQCRFNYSIFDKLELNDFISFDEFFNFFHQTKLRYMEIYCKMTDD
jgi:FkbM family methyltransferase